MSTLGIGVRVYIGYDPMCDEPGIVCRTGTIAEGPFSPDHTFLDHKGQAFGFPAWTWGVQIDGDSGFTAIEERLLTPIYRDPDALTVDEQEEVEA